MNDFIYNLWDIILDLSPWLLFGCLIAGGLHVFMPAGFIRKHLGHGGLGSIIKAVAIGVPMPLCSCGVIPTAIGLKKDGASDGAAIGFLISTPQTGVDSIMVSAGFLGWPFAIFKVISAFITGLIGGIIVNLLTGNRTGPAIAAATEKPACCCSKPEPVKTESSCCSEAGAVTASNCCSTQADTNSSEKIDLPKPALKEMLSFSIKLLRDIHRWLIPGIILAALITTVMPEGKLAEFKWATGLTGMLIMLVISMPMYICATSSVPLAASLVAAGLPGGAALVLLMAGPATNIATISAIAGAFGRKVTAIYIATVAVMSIILGLCFNWLIVKSDSAQAACHGHTLPETIGVTAAIIFIGLLGWFILTDITRKPAANGK
ncbi:MAG: SO_0444 family Cu/Zn efflux transporter [Sedimentisphaerales bacterium]|nr:SO_0444 family Cu/Zn efflux transporter [Sedimentisphaerales bacterium]